ncbi:MAG: helix-turn-helix domain-containing protein, partial [Desulfoprunum sp.]|nr:helix-turn-helix domain-containing protein [Desulfoprunum sp.]
ELLDFLVSYRWPGNVREMQNLVERMVILAETEHLTLGDLPPEVRAPLVPFKEDVPPLRIAVEPASPLRENQGRLSLQDIERTEVESALKRHGWVQVRAAKELGLTQRQMGYKIKKYNLSRYDAY